jgi:hypothetical protein
MIISIQTPREDKMITAHSIEQLNAEINLISKTGVVKLNKKSLRIRERAAHAPLFSIYSRKLRESFKIGIAKSISELYTRISRAHVPSQKEGESGVAPHPDFLKDTGPPNKEV